MEEVQQQDRLWNPAAYRASPYAASFTAMGLGPAGMDTTALHLANRAPCERTPQPEDMTFGSDPTTGMPWG